MEHRYEIVKSMHTIICALNNEAAYYDHWILLVPDCATDEDLRDIAEDNTLFSDTCHLFRRIFPRYADDGIFADRCVW